MSCQQEQPQYKCAERELTHIRQRDNRSAVGLRLWSLEGGVGGWEQHDGQRGLVCRNLSSASFQQQTYVERNEDMVAPTCEQVVEAGFLRAIAEILCVCVGGQN